MASMTVGKALLIVVGALVGITPPRRGRMNVLGKVGVLPKIKRIGFLNNPYLSPAEINVRGRSRWRGKQVLSSHITFAVSRGVLVQTITSICKFNRQAPTVSMRPRSMKFRTHLLLAIRVPILVRIDQ
jgi:hypothetical protein